MHLVTDSQRAYALRIDEVINFVEANYAEPLALERMADVAQFSPFHFHRIFRAAVGEAPHAYLTRIRLEKAIGQMSYGPKRSLTEIAIESGFASGSHFSRSFKASYGFSPKGYSAERFGRESKIRQELLTNAGYDFSVDVADGFRVKIADRPAIRIAYVRAIGGKNIRAALERLQHWSRSRALEGQLIGRSKDNAETTPKSRYRYDWCIQIPDDFKPDREVSYGRIAARKFVVLRCEGDIRKLFRAWSYLYRDWLPASGYQPADEAAMEVFLGELSTTHFDLDCCIPIEPLRS